MVFHAKIYSVVAAVVVTVVALAWWGSSRHKVPEVETISPVISAEVTPLPLVTSPEVEYKTIRTSELTRVPEQYNYSAEIPKNWEVEIIKEAEAINIYDPDAVGANNLEKSQIFIRFFRASSFLTLTKVNVLERQELTIAGRPAVRYIIEKKASVPDFPNQPSWRNQKHTVTDIRVSDTNPSVFYVVAQRPDLSDAIYAHFFSSIQVSAKASLVEPTQEFKSRITKKTFGQYITPQDSPIQPERFTGYHTGVDVEFTDTSSEVPVRAIASGKVELAQSVSGYGGVVVIHHTLEAKPILVLYGHLAPSALPKVGKEVVAGEIIGRLGAGGTSETDGERKHLHFAMLKKSTLDLAGYVSIKSALDAGWYNPLDFYAAN